MYAREQRENFHRLGTLGLLNTNFVVIMLRLVARQKFPSMSSLDPRLQENNLKVKVHSIGLIMIID